MPLPSGIKAKKLTSAVDERSILGKLEKVDLGISQARIVERTDGTKAVWKIDTSNPISARLQHGEVIGLTDGGRRQLGMASILDEFDDVVVPRMRRLQTIDGYGVIESEFIPDYVSISKNPRSQFKKLNALLKDNHLTAREYAEITEQAERQAIVNLVFGNGDVELGFIKLPHSARDDPSSYIRLVRFDEEQAFLGLLDYPILHQSVSSERIPQVLSSANDHIFGLFNYEDFIKQGEFDFEKAERKFSGVVKKLDGIVSDESEFLAKMKRAGYTDDEARTILKGAQKNVGKIKQELTQRDRGLVQKLIENDGDLLPTANGEYVSINERMARQLPRQPGRSEPRVDYAKQVPDEIVVGEFVPRREKTAAEKSKSPFELPVEFRSVSLEYTASIRGKVPKAVVTKELVGGDSGGGTALVFAGRIEGVDKDVALKVATEVMVSPPNLEEAVKMWNREAAFGQELEKIIPTPHYYGIVDIRGNPTLGLEQVDGVVFKFGKPITPLSDKEYTDLVSEKTIEQLFDGLQQAEDHGWEANDIQYFVLTKDQIVNGKQYRRGDVIFFDFEGWRKGEVISGVTPRNEAEALQYQLKQRRIPPHEIAVANRAVAFPVAIPPGAAKMGFPHLEKMERLFAEGKIDEARVYFNRLDPNELIPDDWKKLDEEFRRLQAETDTSIDRILTDFFEEPVVVGNVHGLEGQVSRLYDRVGKRNMDEVFQLSLEKSLGPNMYGGKAAAYVKDDGTIAVVFLTETGKTHHQHALANIIGGEKGKPVYERRYDDPLLADLADRAFGFEFLFDKKRGKIIDIKHKSQITTIQIGKGVGGWRLNENVIDTVEQQLLNKIDPELFDESFFEMSPTKWVHRKELPILTQCP